MRVKNHSQETVQIPHLWATVKSVAQTAMDNLSTCSTHWYKGSTHPSLPSASPTDLVPPFPCRRWARWVLQAAHAAAGCPGWIYPRALLQAALWELLSLELLRCFLQGLLSATVTGDKRTLASLITWPWDGSRLPAYICPFLPSPSLHLPLTSRGRWNTALWTNLWLDVLD